MVSPVVPEPPVAKPPVASPPVDAPPNAAPPVAVARYAYLQRDLVTNLFPDQDPSTGLAAGQNGGGSTKEPFAGRDRITILLLASDAGPDRTGVRTDSVVAASIKG